MTKRGIHLLLLVFVFITLLAACTQQRTPCYDPKIVTVAIGTYRMADTVAVDTSLPDPAFYCIDTPVGQGRGSTNKFNALLSPFVDSTRWVLIPDQDDSVDGTPFELYDTLTFYHLKKLTFISNSCGYVYYYNLLDVKTTHNSIDSLVLFNASVNNNANTQHIKIFY
jgi:hypothetical protein